MRRVWIALDLLLVVVCAVAAVPSWRQGVHTTWFAAVGDQPAFESTHYTGPWLALAALLVAAAGLAAIDLVVRCAVQPR
ncbi:hypothetical protein [Nocardia vermiculata]|uniref:DUF1648 domain-containing protein n=1 Tax=Nocardia vermiculata TaxID=257274 RepID=A0A846YAG5_9NOCA|nr:hypothetical protein [Nocardia vermiculata]NKY54198.1 hypothetical protein [Nocardia vermiculata]